MDLTLLVLAVAIPVAVPLARRWGRAAGWPLAGLYLLAFAAFLPTTAAVLRGENPAVARPWVPTLGVDLALRADGLGVVFASIALLVGAVVLAYSARYLGDGRHVSFYVVMAAFTFAMVALVLADDLVVLFVCWELTSLASFLLIARSGRPGEVASMRTLLLTFVGGVALLVAVVLVARHTGTTSLHDALASPVWREQPQTAGLVAVLVAIAGFSKAAQFPFHVWLPDAMAAPTPVSAYLHAAAVVKAGIFLLLRFSTAFHATPIWNVMLVATGLFTAVLGARFALEQTDLKRLMAYSTVSQLGLIVATIGIGTPVALAAAVVHTVAHALFKSGLFMMVGVVDHAAHTRDIRRLPPLWRAMPGSFAVTTLGCASMAGLPPLLGFVSKESLFAGLLDAPGPRWTGWLALTGAALVSVMTFGYCVKIALGGFVDGRDTRSLAPTETPLLALAAVPIAASLPLGLASGVLDPVVSTAVTAMLPGTSHQPDLSLWHGVTAELVATAVVIAVGVRFAVSRRGLWRILERPTLPIDGPELIARSRRALRRLGTQAARPTADDRPVRHLGAIVAGFVVVLAAGWYAAASSGAMPASRSGWGRPLDVVLVALIAAAVVAVCRASSRLAATVSLSAVGIVATVQLLALGAPDVALTQLLVESLTIIVIMLVLQRLPPTFAPVDRRRKVTAAAMAGTAGIAAAVVTWQLTGRRDRSAVAQYYLENAQPVTGGANVVNVILVEFRALDTLGEVAVLGMAGIAVLAVISTIRSRHVDPPPEEEHWQPEPDPDLPPAGTVAHRAVVEVWPNAVPLQILVRFLSPLLVVASVLVFLRGHNSPGGGFIAALVGSSIVGLVYLSTSHDRAVGPPRLPTALIGGGLSLAVLVGLAGYAAAGSFLEPLYGEVVGVKVSSSLVFDAGVYAAVLGLVMLAFNLLGTGRTAPGDPDVEGTRERADEAVEGELPGPLDTVRGERPARPGIGTAFVTTGQPPSEADR